MKNNQLQELIKELKTLAIEKQVDLWKRVATDLERPTRQRRVVNISRINTFTIPDEIVIVPGKVLSGGELDHPVTVAALNFSENAGKKIAVKGKVMSIQELIRQNPEGKKVRIIG